jgi:hypothetical protein
MLGQPEIPPPVFDSRVVPPHEPAFRLHSFRAAKGSVAMIRRLGSSFVFPYALVFITACSEKPTAPSELRDNAVYDYSACSALAKPTWFAYQDGTTGVWTPLVATNDIYQFSITQDRGAVAHVRVGQVTFVQFGTRAELAGGYACDGSLNTVSGNVAGIPSNDFAMMSLGGSIAVANTNGSFTLDDVQPGNADFIASLYTNSGSASALRVIIRRDQDIANNGTLGVADFTSAEAFAPATATLTILGAGNDETVQNLSYLTSVACRSAALPFDPNPSLTMLGIPAARQRPSDFHLLRAGAVTVDGANVRMVYEAFHTLANRSVTIGPALPAPAVTSLPGPYKRLQFAMTLPAEYQGGYAYALYQNPLQAFPVTMIASFGYLNAASATITFPDFSAVAGWQNAWAPSPSAPGLWVLEASNSLVGVVPCSEGARMLLAAVSGNY